jgi:hypothetical protein
MEQMNNSESGWSFEQVVQDVPKIGRENHSQTLLHHAQENLKYFKKSINDLKALPEIEKESAIVISAGPSVHKFNSINRIRDNYKGKIISIDGAYVNCLKRGVIPDYVLSLDPHLKRIVRWFGDPNFEENMAGDDYFDRQDLDVEFRKNSINQNLANIKLVNEHAHKTKLILCSSAPPQVVDRAIEAGFDIYWWNPLVDNPSEPQSLTRKLYAVNKLPCMNTGGTVGTAAWVFASSILKIKSIGMVGMDLGYHMDTPYNMTQTYYELIQHVGLENLEKCFIRFTFPLTQVEYYTDPTYFWYRKNFLELLSKSNSENLNCTEGGTLFGEHIQSMTLDTFFNRFNKLENYKE